MNSIVPTREEVASAVEKYNARYGEMDEALWCLSNASRPLLLRGQTGQVLERLVWTVRSWWGVQGVISETATSAGRALADMEWSSAMFTEEVGPVGDPEAFQAYAIHRVSGLVERMKDFGVPRAEFVLSAKVLHWLMPWRVPAYDSFVRKSLGASGHQEYAYLDIARWEFDNALRLMAEGSDWLGSVNPRSPLRALDKYLWRMGGGDVGTAVIVSDPWEVCKTLGLIDS